VAERLKWFDLPALSATLLALGYALSQPVAAGYA